MGTIYLVRHGQASFGSANYDQLSPLGYEQARLLGQWLANSRQDVQRVVCGGMQRHRQTADTCMAEMPKALLSETEWLTDSGFAEFDHEQVLLRHCPESADPAGFKAFLASHAEPKRAFQQTFQGAMQRWTQGQWDGDYDESWPAFKARCVAALERLAAIAARDESTIVFTSGGTISVLCQHILGLGDVKTLELNWILANCGMTKLLLRPDAIRLGYLNNYAHLEWLGEAGAVTYR